MSPLDAACVYCGQRIVEDVETVATIDLDPLRDHLLGCPRALDACAPALPILSDRSEVARHFRLDEAKR